jgi:type IV secretion system protein VirD4
VRATPASEPGDLLERLLLTIVLTVAVVVAVFLLASRAAAAVFGHGQLDATIPDAVAALTRMQGHLSDPAGAWAEPQQAVLPGPFAYWAALLAPVPLLAGAVIVGLRIRGRMAPSRKRPLGVAPDAGVARRLRLLEVKAPTTGRLTLGRVGRRLVAAEEAASLAVVGPSGCGKTAGFAIPALLEWDGPVIATSVKTDLLGATLDRRAEKGKVWIYDPTGCTGTTTARWTPLTACDTWGGAQRIAAWLCEAAEPKASSVNDAHYWTNQARLALAPLLHAAATSGATMADVVRWVDTQEVEVVRAALSRAGHLSRLVDAALSGPEAERLRLELHREVTARTMDDLRRLLLAEGGPQAKRAARQPKDWPPPWRERLSEKVAADLEAAVRAELEVVLLRTGGRALDPLVAAEALWAKEERLRSSIYATVQNILLGYADPMVASAADGCDIDLETWLDGPNTIYLVAPHHDQARLRPVLTVLLAAAVRAAYDTANRHQGRLPHPLLALLDEAGNVAAPKDLPAWASTARSHRISLVTVWQDLAQIRSIYGDLAPVIMNNHKAKIFGSGIADPTTLDLASRLVGDHQVKERNHHNGSGNGRNWSEHTTWRRAAPADALRRLDADEALLVYGNQPPARLRLRPWWKERPRRRRT